ncbi:MAG: lysophospholipase [Deltaproteobacteria bacterium]|nr:lysophospholipase [Deltaproteobacteria bacterium]
MVLLHGRTWSARPDFDLQVPGESRSLMDALVAEGFATYAVDQRGYGDTPRDDTGFITPDRAVADLAAVLEWVKARHPSLPSPTLVGWSLGSLVSQLTAQRHPGALSSVVLYGYPRDPDQTYAARGPQKPARKATTAVAAAEDFLIPGAISQAAIDAFVAAALAADPVRADWRGNEQWNALDPAAVHTPTLVIHGEKDPYAPIANQAKLFSRLGTPDRAWIIIAGGDHAAHMENNGPRFVHAVVEFSRRPLNPAPH